MPKSEDASSCSGPFFCCLVLIVLPICVVTDADTPDDCRYCTVLSAVGALVESDILHPARFLFNRMDTVKDVDQYSHLEERSNHTLLGVCPAAGRVLLMFFPTLFPNINTGRTNLAG